MKEKTNDKNIFGFWLYLMSDCVLFASLFAVFAVLRGATFGGPSVVDIFDLPFILGETLILLTSSFTVGLALLAARRRRKTLTLTALTLTLVLGLAFLGMELGEFYGLLIAGEGPAHSAFLSSFFTLVGTHGLHVFFGALWMTVLTVYIVRRGLLESSVRRLTMLSLFWHFLDVVWIFIFTFVYLIGAL